DLPEFDSGVDPWPFRKAARHLRDAACTARMTDSGSRRCRAIHSRARLICVTALRPTVSIAGGGGSRSPPRPKTRTESGPYALHPGIGVLPIAIDVMSGDHEPREYLAGALRALADDPELQALLIGEPAMIGAALAPLPDAVRKRAAVVPATQVVSMDETPREAIRRKKDSSMRVAVDQVRAGHAGACVSAGNTGALTAIAHFVLKTLPGVERAAIISAIPAAHGHTYMLDLGANTKATPEQLRQFAAMGTIVARDVYGVPSPRVGLLNIGEEDIKGHEVVQGAHALLAASGLNYVG